MTNGDPSPQSHSPQSRHFPIRPIPLDVLYHWTSYTTGRPNSRNPQQSVPMALRRSKRSHRTAPPYYVDQDWLCTEVPVDSEKSPTSPTSAVYHTPHPARVRSYCIVGGGNERSHGASVHLRVSVSGAPREEVVQECLRLHKEARYPQTGRRRCQGYLG